MGARALHPAPSRKGDLSDAIAMGELSEFIRPDAIKDVLLDEEAKFNWRSLQRLLAHARVWRPAPSACSSGCSWTSCPGHPACSLPWRMDVALDPECEDGTGHLFIGLNNQTFEQAVARVEVVCPGGEPFARIIGLNSKRARHPQSGQPERRR